MPAPCRGPVLTLAPPGGGGRRLSSPRPPRARRRLLRTHLSPLLGSEAASSSRPLPGVEKSAGARGAMGCRAREAGLAGEPDATASRANLRASAL